MAKKETTTEQAEGANKLPEYLQTKRTEVGRVVSDKMEKTVVVLVERRKQHPIYKKVMKRSVRFMAHDELGAHSGDTVRIIESRPMSAHKRWRVIEIIAKADQV
jgi:small subunit ribosomal protein S17